MLDPFKLIIAIIMDLPVERLDDEGGDEASDEHDERDDGNIVRLQVQRFLIRAKSINYNYKHDVCVLATRKLVLFCPFQDGVNDNES